MPTYDYRCDRCEEQFEIWQSFSDDTLTLCPADGGPSGCEAPGEGPVRKVFSKVGISFKGDGFYKNDHGSRARSSSDASKTAASSDTSKAGTGSAESGSKDSGKSKPSGDSGTSSKASSASGD